MKKNVKNYYVVYIEGIPSNPHSFSSLREAKKYIVDNYPDLTSFIYARRFKDDFTVYSIIYRPKGGFSKTIKY